MPYPVEPNPEFFKKPADLVPGYGTTVTDDGHVYGYLALFNARLIGSGARHKRPPRSRSGYAYANAYTTKCSDGSLVRTGVIAGDGGHRFANGFKPTQEAYADVSKKVANVVYGEDEHGVWFSGALAPHVDEATAQAMRSSGVSGHWERPQQGKPQELLGACLVNIPGFAQAAEHRIVASAAYTPTGGITIAPEVGEAPEPSDARTTPPTAPTGDFSRIMGAGNTLVAAASRLIPVSGVLAALGSPTVDGRQVNSVVWGDLPLPLWSLVDQGEWGHAGARMVGRITSITLDGALVRFTGEIEEGLGDDAEKVPLIADLGVLGISMDGMPSPDFDITYEYDEDGWPSKVIFEQYEIHGATLTGQPAFRETIGVTVGGDGELEPPADTPPAEPVPSEAESSDEDEEPVAASGSPGYTTISLPIIWH